MANGQGFMIPVDQTDWATSTWGPTGVRQSALPNNWYLSQNITLTDPSDNPTYDPQVGTAYTINVGVQGVPDPDETLNLAVVQNVEAWACYPTLTTGAFNAGAVVPSMGSSFPQWAGSTLILPQATTTIPGPPYQDTSGEPPPFVWIPVGTWTPGSNDVMTGNTSAHACLIANCAGLADASVEGIKVTGAPVGAAIPSLAGLAGGFDACTSIYQAQHNITIVAVSGGTGHQQIHLRFGFLAANPSLDRATDVVVEVRPVTLRELDPLLLRALSSGRYAKLEPQLASAEHRALRLHDNEHSQPRKLEAVLIRAVELIIERIEELLHPFRDSCRLRLRLPPGGLHPLEFEAELDPGLRPGSVNVFDITDTEPGGRRGGIRLVTVVLPPN